MSHFFRDGFNGMPGLKVLYIEDNLENTILVRRILEAEGITVIDALDGKEGLKRARDEMPDLILMDLHLPEMDGYEATTQIKNTPKLKQIPVIALTANVLKRDKEKAYLAGCDGYIEKPIDVDLFADQIRQFVSQASTE